MSYEVARQVITSYFQANFLNEQDAEPLPVEYPNRIYALPDGAAAAPWARFSIRHGMKQATDVGTRSSRIGGEATLQIFLPEDSGVKLGRQLGDLIISFMEDVFLGTDDGVVRFRKVSVRELPPDNGWDQTSVVMPFERDIYGAGQAGTFIPYVPPGP